MFPAPGVVAVLRSTFGRLGLKFDCSSGWEVKRSIAAGVPPESLCLR